jgi:HK97 family phage prohead protease
MTAPVDNLVRARYDTGAIELRAAGDGGTGRTLNGYFAVFDRWTEIDSWYEGRFLERLKRGAFKRTIKERASQIRVLYEHGRDPSIGNKPLAVPEIMREDAEGCYGQGELFEASYVDDLIPALSAGQMGSSFRFRVVGEQWVEPKKATDSNPAMLPERTITDVDLYEWGPCPFPAYADATAGVRSGTDAFVESLLADPAFLLRFSERVGPNVAAHVLAQVSPGGRTSAASDEPPGGRAEQASRTSALLAVERARLALA